MCRQLNINRYMKKERKQGKRKDKIDTEGKTRGTKKEQKNSQKISNNS